MTGTVFPKDLQPPRDLLLFLVTAVVFYTIGDFVTTAIGVFILDANELNPFINYIIQTFGILGLLCVKLIEGAIIVGFCVLLDYYIQMRGSTSTESWIPSIPTSAPRVIAFVITAFGVAIVINNTYYMLGLL